MEHGGYRDDSTISDEAELWRRIHPKQWELDGNLGRIRPVSGAFDDPSDGTPMSVDLADVYIQMGQGPEAALIGYEEFALAAITARLIRECGLGVARQPLPENPAHAVVFGKKSQKIRRKLAREARWVVPPTNS
jgi:hypothetical protein